MFLTRNAMSSRPVLVLEAVLRSQTQNTRLNFILEMMQDARCMQYT